jgi:hypothetical protein
MTTRSTKKQASKRAAPARKATAGKATAKSAAAKNVATKKPVAKKKVAATKPSRPQDPADRLRAICLSFPEAHEVEAWGEPTFRVKNKIFAMHSSATTHHTQGRESVWICSTSTEQDLMLRVRPDRYFKPPYVGPSGWVGAYLDKSPPWAELTELLREAYRRKAPKKLVAMMDETE